MVKLLALLLVAVVALGLIALAISVMVAVIFVVCRLLIAIALSLALAVGLGTAVALVSGSTEPHTVGFLVSVLAFVPGLAFSWRWVNPFRTNPRAADVAASLEAKVAAPLAIAEPLEPAGDQAVAAAWESAATLAPAHNARLVAARQSCAALLRQFGENNAALDVEWIEAAMRIRRHIPPFVAESRLACEGLIRAKSTRIARTW